MSDWQGGIQELVVHETVRSKGIGAELVSRLEEAAEVGLRRNRSYDEKKMC